MDAHAKPKRPRNPFSRDILQTNGKQQQRGGGDGHTCPPTQPRSRGESRRAPEGRNSHPIAAAKSCLGSKLSTPRARSRAAADGHGDGAGLNARRKGADSCNRGRGCNLSAPAPLPRPCFSMAANGNGFEHERTAPSEWTAADERRTRATAPPRGKEQRE